MKIAIIGFGRFGQLWAKIMKDFGEVLIFNDSNKRAIADNLGVRYFGFDQLKNLKEADYIFIAVPIRNALEVMQKIKPFVRRGSLVMDVCSVKVNPCKWLQEVFSDEVEIMGTHPMFGPDSAKTGLAGKQMVLCPLRISEEKLKLLRDIFTKLELQIIETTPEEHDRQTAYSLAMVHFLGRGLEKLELEQITIRTLGFESLLTLQNNVSNDSWQLFEDMQSHNPYAEEMRRRVVDSLVALENSLVQTASPEGESYEQAKQ